MKLLSDILKNVKINQLLGNADIVISSVAFDSRKVEHGSVFFAISGTRVDGHSFISEVIEKGAKAIVCEVLPIDIMQDVTYVKVNNSAETMGIMASNWFDNPSRKLKLVGITGTNGKTTTATLLFNLFQGLGYGVGLLSTIANQINDDVIPATHTTPDTIDLNGLLKQMVEKGCEYCFMEVSSHAVVQQRVAGLHFAGGIFSNITLDHLDFHKTFDAYIKAKKGFFDMLPQTAFALTNIDDKNGLVMLQNTKALKKTYSFQHLADFKGKLIEAPLTGLHLEINGVEMWSRLVGRFNAYNVLSVYAAAVLLGEDAQEVLRVLSGLKSIKGRFDYIIAENGTIAIVDYAHTPDALENVIETINDLRAAGQQLITVVGCGGDRDATKRPIMARIATENSTRTILTSDNPRTEDPDEIIRQMYEGVSKQYEKNVVVMPDRKEAIKLACILAGEDNIILVAGKGHENYQEINGVKHHFDDKEVLAEYLLEK